MISFTVSGSTDTLEKWLNKVDKLDVRSLVAPLAERGVEALRSATPVDTRLAASSWDYDITGSKTNITISWTNTDIEGGFPVAIMLQYGHGTGTGGYVEGRDYINPAIRPIFDQIADEVWKAVTSA
jgi:hypothetical protein